MAANIPCKGSSSKKTMPVKKASSDKSAKKAGPKK